MFRLEIDKRDPLRRFPDNYVPPRSLTLTKQKRVDSLARGCARVRILAAARARRPAPAKLDSSTQSYYPPAALSFSLFLPRAVHHRRRPHSIRPSKNHYALPRAAHERGFNSLLEK